MRSIVIIAHDIRSCHNVGSLLRTAEGLGVDMVYLTGYTPYPLHVDDTRLPHEALKLHAKIIKTALGAESLQAWRYEADISTVLAELKVRGFQLCALEQSPGATALNDFKPGDNIAVVLGREVEGIAPELLEKIPQHIYIPMFGAKESFNVVQAAAMALYALRFD